MPIHLLPAEVASQIAAGEVIERPASVVKELLENALDSGATFISITVQEGGQRLVEVADDGSGIPAAEMPLAVERHATSKLVNADDLFHIATLGFRGEALASIGSVSRLTITSRPRSAASGARLVIEGGSNGPLQPVGAAAGTLVRVEDLFYNVPARKKFLKKENTERRTIDELVTRYALAYPQVRFRLEQDGRLSLQTAGNGQRREVLAALYGVEVARQMLEVLSQEEGLNVQGFISPPSLSRSNRRELNFFVNGRPVRDAALVTALTNAYHTLLMVGRFPLAILFLEVAPDAVDVNVHPTKAEVRFREPERVFAGVQRAVRRAILAHTPAQGLEVGLRWSSGASPEAPSPAWERPAPSAWEDRWMVRPAAGEPPPLSGAADEALDAGLAAGGVVRRADGVEKGMPGLRTPILRLIGQIANTYLVAEGPDGLYLIDQHAAHERVLFERFLAQQREAGEAGLPAQALLHPLTIELAPAAARLLLEQLPFLGKLGFQVEPFGQHTFLLRSIPSLLSGSDPAAAVRVLIEDFEEDETPLQAEREARLVARICKRAAVKAGRSLPPEEQAALLRDLEDCQQPRTCPHGRPTMIHLSVDLLERQFGRRGAR